MSEQKFFFTGYYISKKGDNMPTVPAINHNIMPPQNYPYNEEKKLPRINVKYVLTACPPPAINGTDCIIRTSLTFIRGSFFSSLYG